MSNHLKLGSRGELLASTHLQAQGYTILEKNWRYRRAEIDIICLKKDVLVFVEVKTRTSSYLGSPLEAVGISKQRQVIKAADEYIKRYEGEPDIRFDIIGVIANEK